MARLKYLVSGICFATVQYCTVHVRDPHSTERPVPVKSDKKSQSTSTMTRFPSNQLVLNYHDAILYGSDIELLQNERDWLNDACMHFYLTVLQQMHPDITFMDPSVITFLRHQCDEEDLNDFATGFDKSRFIYMIPVNNGHSNSTTWQRPGGGSHWSLLFISTQHGKEYLHFDSVAGNNASAAREVAKTFSLVLKHENVSVREVETPQQHNGYDCGLHALAAAEMLSEARFTGSVAEKASKITFQRLGKPNLGLEMRTKVLNKAFELEKEYRT